MKRYDPLRQLNLELTRLQQDTTGIKLQVPPLLSGDASADQVAETLAGVRALKEQLDEEANDPGGLEERVRALEDVVARLVGELGGLD